MESGAGGGVSHTKESGGVHTSRWDHKSKVGGIQSGAWPRAGKQSGFMSAYSTLGGLWKAKGRSTQGQAAQGPVCWGAALLPRLNTVGAVGAQGRRLAVKMN